MAELRRTSVDQVGPDGQPVVGRGYDVLDEGRSRGDSQLRPDAFEDVAMVRVEPRTPEERQALAFPHFGLDRDVTLRVVDDDGETSVEVLDADGERRAGWIRGEEADALARLLVDEPDLDTWVCWEEQHDTSGRVGLAVALSRPGIRPQPLGPPSRQGGAGAGGGSLLADQRVWLAVGLAVILLFVVVVTRLL